jgi:hypothetical protein
LHGNQRHRGEQTTGNTVVSSPAHAVTSDNPQVRARGLITAVEQVVADRFTPPTRDVTAHCSALENSGLARTSSWKGKASQEFE